MMATEGEGSVTHWIGDLKGGDLAAAQPLWERYFARLVQLARAKLKATRHGSPVEDEEDAALSAFNSFCEGAARPVPDAVGPRRSVAAAHGDHRPQGVRADPAPDPAEAGGGHVVGESGCPVPTTKPGAAWSSSWATSRRPNSRRSLPRSISGCSTCSTTTKSAGFSLTGWKATPTTRLPSGSASPGGPWRAGSS